MLTHGHGLCANMYVHVCCVHAVGLASHMHAYFPSLCHGAYFTS